MTDWRGEPYAVQADTIIVSRAISESVLDEVLVAQLAFGDPRVPGHVKAATATRMVACMNACKGIPTSSLDDGIIERAMRAIITLAELKERDDRITQ